MQGDEICLLSFEDTPLPSARQHPSYDEMSGGSDGMLSEQLCAELCDTMFTAHLCEQFLQVQQIGFVTLGPLHCV